MVKGSARVIADVEPDVILMDYPMNAAMPGSPTQWLR